MKSLIIWVLFLLSQPSLPSFAATVARDDVSLGPKTVYYNGPLSNYLEFSRYGFLERGAMGALGSFEMNLSYNMDYADGVHRYYDSTKSAVWLALNGNGYAIQYAPPGLEADIWRSAGHPYLLYGNAAGQLMLGATLESVVEGYSAQFTLPRPGGNASIAGMSDLVIEGARKKGKSGPVYINTYNSGNVLLATGGGSVGVGTIHPHPGSSMDMSDSGKPFIPPKMTSEQKEAIIDPQEGMVVYDLTLHKLCVYTGVWEIQ